MRERERERERGQKMDKTVFQVKESDEKQVKVLLLAPSRSLFIFCLETWKLGWERKWAVIRTLSEETYKQYQN